MNESKIVMLTGSGINADSGLATFGGIQGLWQNYGWEQVASPAG